MISAPFARTRGRSGLGFAALAFLALTCSACGVGAIGESTASAPHAAGTVGIGGTRPLLVDWGPNDRTELNLSRAHGPLVVAFSNGVLEPLFNCHVKGKIAFTYSPDSSAQVQSDDIDNDDELKAKMPAFGAQFSAALARAGQLHVRMKVVGAYSADRTTFMPDDLEGPDCARATHVSASVTVGAFRLFTGASGAVSADVSALGAEAGGHSASAEQNLNEAGSEAACDKASSSDKEPPAGCSTSLQLGLAPLGVPLNADGSPEYGASPSKYWGGQRIAGTALMGVGVAVVAVGIVEGVHASNTWSSSQSECASAANCPDHASAVSNHDDASRAATISTVTLAAGGAAAVGGLVLFLTSPSGHPTTGGLSIAPAIGERSQGLTLRGGF